MLKVEFYDKTEDDLLEFAVIVSRYEGKWVYCKHKERSTYEVPGGHREKGEDINHTAERELHEETGAVTFDLHKICAYSVETADSPADNQGIKQEAAADNARVSNKKTSYGMLYYADIKEFGRLPDMEMEKTVLFDAIPDNLTYPLIQPELIRKVKEFLEQNPV